MRQNGSHHKSNLVHVSMLKVFGTLTTPAPQSPFIGDIGGEPHCLPSWKADGLWHLGRQFVIKFFMPVTSHTSLQKLKEKPSN